ncbi:MAG: PD40 domain-containing protein [Acidobacteria bacterium]|nr:PD40 domain-containing protein [Acidobacteriota bacterium]
MTSLHRNLLVTALAAGLAVTGGVVADGLLTAETIVQQPQQVDEVALALTNPGAHPRLGLPDFVMSQADPKMAAIAKTVADVLWDDLDFEREYYLIPRASSTSISVTPIEALPYAEWATLGADVVLHGNASASGQTLVIELRLVAVKGTTPGTQYFGKRYQCGVQTARGPRDCAHQIADDFHRDVRKVDGVARTKLAFASDRDSGRVSGRPNQAAAASKEIYISDYDGANQTRFTINRSINISPSWSPTGGLLAYTSYSSGYPDVYVANLAQPGRGLQRPARGNESIHNQMSAWSPDGSQIAFVSNRTGDYDIWISNRDGSGLRNLTNFPRANEGSPTWSPNGQMIAFTSDRSGLNNPQLFVMNTTGTNLNRLAAERIDRPTWSSQNFIAFAVGSPGAEIGIYDFNNPGVRILTSGVGINESPAVSPNGRHIAFVTTRWGRQEIAVMDRTGQRVKRITTTGNNTFPNWQPIPGR